MHRNSDYGQDNKRLVKWQPSDLEGAHLRFWKRLLDRAKAAGILTHATCSPSGKSWIVAGTGEKGIAYAYAISLTQGWIKAELLMQSPETARNKEIFDALYEEKRSIEALFGGPLEWYRSNDKKRSRICSQVDRTHLGDETTWDEAQNSMIDMMKRLSTAMSSFV